MSWTSITAEEIRRGSDFGDDGTVTVFTDTPEGRYLTLSGGESLLVPWGESVTVED